MYPARLDDKGRLKLPVPFQQFFSGLPEKRLYVTSLDRRIARIYPMAVWRENEKFFDGFRDNMKASRAIAFIANDLGAESELDGQGRVLFPPELRRELGIENQPVKMHAYRGHVVVMSDAVYAEQKRQAAEAAADSLDLLEQAGLK